jgi:putative redox protein
MRLYADRKQWPLESLEMTVTLTRNADNTTQIHKELTINGELSEEERQRLLQIADKCPVHKILSNPISFSSVISS